MLTLFFEEISEKCLSFFSKKKGILGKEFNDADKTIT